MEPEKSQPPSEPLDYEARAPVALRIVTLPRKLDSLNRFLLKGMGALGVVYGVFLLLVRWLLKVVGVVFVVADKRPPSSEHR